VTTKVESCAQGPYGHYGKNKIDTLMHEQGW